MKIGSGRARKACYPIRNVMRSPFRPLPCTLASVRGVRRAWSHGGGALPEGTRTHRAACRRGLGAWLASLAGRSASRRSGDPVIRGRT
jgi:hypothetical protein